MDEPCSVRLGDAARSVRRLVGDATTPLFGETSIDLWHDRAVFRFLTEPARRDAYIGALRRSVRPGGLAIVATFGPDGPESCRRLPMTRYASSDIAAALGAGFQLVEQADEEHTTPRGAVEAFAYALLRQSAVWASPPLSVTASTRAGERRRWGRSPSGSRWASSSIRPVRCGAIRCST